MLNIWTTVISKVCGVFQTSTKNLVCQWQAGNDVLNAHLVLLLEDKIAVLHKSQIIESPMNHRREEACGNKWRCLSV